MKQRRWLKEIRETKNMTQSNFAELLNVPVTTYASWEQGVRTPSVDKAKEVAEILNIKWTIFFDHQVLETSSK
ncbi:helix-turn-helix transcriptional regulator [Companilactobacillus futsaii]|uniref:Helix-turn-helix transcriptional regulator n=2 Tax=Companilactobacillus futsaii TaxID=938155 RepID=A0A5B7T330_9LACO|nr:helix-turn-helix transcriptional regulator [Companilactobacillus futsaii]QCX24561.1 helix-turn-helix transcriptional regulator [Companilactobacillus futsaii]